MATRKSMTLPILLTFILIGIVVYLFTTIKQTEVTCKKITTFPSTISIKEEVISRMDGKKITSLEITKTINLPEKYAKEESYQNQIKQALDRTLEYLGNKVKYTISPDRIIVKIEVHKDEIILLDNILFSEDDDFQIKINSNTKSSEVITLAIGDNYTDGEFMKRLKQNGYSCK